MPTTLTNGIQLPDKGSVDWYGSMQSNYNLIDTHLGDTDTHVTAEDKANWNSKQGSLSQAQLDAIAQVATNTSDIATLQSSKADASHTHSSSDITDIDDYATKQYVDNSISGLVDSAPNALDTLNELAAALNDDANFATTVTNALSAKANSADLATVATSGDYDDLSNKPTINDSTITIQKNGSTVDTFTTNGSNKTINIPVPTKTSDLTNDSNFVDTSNSAVASGITSAKVTDYDTHIADTDIHVTTSDKTTWNAVTSKANDSDVVHTSGVETVGGQKTFTDDITVSKNASNMAIYLQNLSYDPKTNGQSGIEGKSCGINFLTSTGDAYINISAYGLSERTLLRLTNSYFTDSQNVDYDSVEFSVYGNGSRSFRPRNTSNCDLGESNKKWKGVYATNYYYGSNSVEFSTKFVTTDTDQTISGVKTFDSNTYIYNSDNTATTPTLFLKNSKATKGSTSETGSQLLKFIDKNNNGLCDLESIVTSTGSCELRLRSNTLDSNNQNVQTGVTLISSANGGKNFCPTSDSNVFLGASTLKWARVYSTRYYYGNDNVEFSTKFVTTDTAQTVSGAKTFSDTLTIYNSDSSQNTKNLTISSSKIQVGDTSNSDSFGISFNAGLSYVSRVTAFKDTSGTQNLQLTVRTKDSSNNFINSMARLRLYTNGYSCFEPDVNTSISLGSSSNKWNKINGVEPSSLSLPIGTLSDQIDISSYFSNTGSLTNSYTAPANGWIYLRLGDISSCQATVYDANNNRMWGQSSTGSVEQLTIPILKGQTLTTQWATTSSVTVANAKFIPCQGNV